MNHPTPGDVYELDGERWTVYRINESGTVFMQQNGTERYRSMWASEWQQWAAAARKVEPTGEGE